MEWGKTNVTASDGFKCNFNQVLCSINATIPGVNGAPGTEVGEKVYYPKEKLAEWSSTNLTTAHIKYKASINVNESPTLKLASCGVIAELPNEQHKKLMNSWFDACNSNATLFDAEGMENTTIQRQKSAVFFDQVRVAVGNLL